MDRDQTLHRIEGAASEEEVFCALREFIADPANGLESIAAEMHDASDVAGIAFELTQRRLFSEDPDAVSPDLEAVFARATVRIAELLDNSGGWAAYRLRSSSKPPPRATDVHDWVEGDPGDDPLD